MKNDETKANQPFPLSSHSIWFLDDVEERECVSKFPPVSIQEDVQVAMAVLG